MPRAHAATARPTSEPLVVTLFDAPPPAAGAKSAAARGGASEEASTAAEPAEPTPEKPVRRKPRRRPNAKPEPKPEPKAKAIPSPEKAEPRPTEPPEKRAEAEQTEVEEAEVEEAGAEPETTESSAEQASSQTTSAAAGSGQGDPDATAAGQSGNGDDAQAKAATARPARRLEVLPFGQGMTRPKLISKEMPVYTREAREAKVGGLFLAKCVITRKGKLEKCRVVKGLPLMNDAILTALSHWRYTPVQYQGRAVNVDYVIKVRLQSP